MSEAERKNGSQTALTEKPWFNLLGRFLALALVFAFFAIFVEDGRFVSLRNLENILRQSAVYATAALGMTMVIVAGGIDLSVGSIIALAVVAIASVMNLHYPGVGGERVHFASAFPALAPLAALAAGLLAATLAGLLNGLTVVGLRLVPFIVTLGTMGVFRGVAKGIADERDIYPPTGSWLDTVMDPTLTSPDPARRWMLLPPGVWILLISAVAAALFLRYTRQGRHIYAVGSNPETARLCGVTVGRTRVLVFMLAGFFAGLAGLMQFSFISGIGQPTTAHMYELFVIAAVVIGGGSLMGGEGSILGSIIGALLITILYMGGQQMGWPKWVQEMVIGGIIVVSVAIDQLRHRREA